ncbi:putative membrane protein (plasmid) [Clostridium botulinum]|nr:putative membrane protein [Clostridium botulinum]
MDIIKDIIDISKLVFIIFAVWFCTSVLFLV